MKIDQKENVGDTNNRPQVKKREVTGIIVIDDLKKEVQKREKTKSLNQNKGKVKMKDFLTKKPSQDKSSNINKNLEIA